MEPSKKKRHYSAVWFQLKDIKYQRQSLPFLRAIFMGSWFILIGNLWVEHMLIDMENLHLWYSNVLSVRNTDCLHTFLLRGSLALSKEQFQTGPDLWDCLE